MVARDLDRRFAVTHLAGDALVVSLLCINRGGVAAAHHVAALPAHGLDVDLLVSVAGDELEGGLENVGVECPGKAFVAADDDEQHALLGAGDKERMLEVAGLIVVEIDTVPRSYER